MCLELIDFLLYLTHSLSHSHQLVLKEVEVGSVTSLKHFCLLQVPRIYWEHTTERVLMMEYCDGGKVNDREYMKKRKISVDQVSKI